MGVILLVVVLVQIPSMVVVAMQELIILMLAQPVCPTQVLVVVADVPVLLVRVEVAW
jgi:hypothetical protein